MSAARRHDLSSTRVLFSASFQARPRERLLENIHEALDAVVLDLHRRSHVYCSERHGSRSQRLPLRATI
jgi:hypothetical protein